jgi:putative membrane protein
MISRRTLTLFGASIALAAPALAADHPTGVDFLHHAIEGDNSEMTLGMMAARNGHSPAVRSFGHMLETDHRKAKNEAAALARRLHTYVPRSMAAEAIRERAKLSRLRGRDFDREFADYMVKDHEQDIADFQAEAAARDDPRLTGLARHTIPTLGKHLATARRLAGR